MLTLYIKLISKNFKLILKCFANNIAKNLIYNKYWINKINFIFLKLGIPIFEIFENVNQ